MTIQQFLSVILSRKRLLLAVFVSVVALATGVSFLLSKQYIAQAVIAVDAGSADPVSSLSMTGGGMVVANYLGTQASMLSSHNTARKVVQTLGLSQSPEVQANYQAVAGGDGAGIDDWLATVLLQGLTVESGRDSNTLSISFKSVDPLFAATIANAFIEAYKQMVIESRVGTASQNEAFFKTQIDELKRNLESKQKALSDYQKEQGVLATGGDRIDLESQKLMALAAQVAAAQADYIAARSQLNANGQLNVDPLSNPLIQQLTVQLADLEKNRQDLAQREGPNHPGYRQVVTQIAATRGQLEALKQKYGSMQASTVENMEKRLQAQQQELALQKQKVLDLKDQQSQIDILLRGIDNAQRNYDLVMQKWSESVLQANANLTNITVLQRAVPPLRAASPNIPFNIFISIFLGLFLGAAVNYLLDMLNRRVRCTDDIEVLLQLPVLAELNRKPKQHHLLPRWFRPAAKYPSVKGVSM